MFAFFDAQADAILEEQTATCEIAAPTGHEQEQADYVRRQLAALNLVVRQMRLAMSSRAIAVRPLTRSC